MNQKHISTEAKPLCWYKALKTVDGRREQRAFLVEGIRAIGQIKTIKPAALLEILTTDKTRPKHYPDCPIRILTSRQYESISPARNPAGPLAVAQLPADVDNAQISDGKRILLLEDIQDPGNVGTIIRSAAAFNFDGVIINDKCADPFGPKSVAASAGAVLSIWIRRESDLDSQVRSLKKDGFRIVATDLQGDTQINPGQQNKLVLALGNEGNGLSDGIRSLADIRLKIPINQNNVQSLNVAACGAICMYLTQIN